MKLIDLTSIRKQNLVKILDLMTLAPPRTRQELAEAAGLSQMTVTNLVDLLKEQGVLQMKPIQRGEHKRPAQGRKADAISLSGEKKAWLLVDISNQQLSMTLVGFDVGLLQEFHDDQRGEYLPRLEAFLQNSRQQVLQALGSRELLGVAVVTPGPYDLASDTVNNQRLPQLNGVQIKAMFRRCLGEYEYYVDEDVKFAVRSFSDLIVSSQCEVLYYLYIGEGVGGAAVHGGNMLRGLNATAGDAGQLTTPDGATYESLLSLSSFAASLGYHDGNMKPLAERLRRSAEERPQDYLHALEQAAAVVSEMLYSVLWVLDPSHIIIDCRYAIPFEQDFIRMIAAKLSARLAASGRRFPSICPAPQGMSSVTRGAVQVLQREWIERILA